MKTCNLCHVEKDEEEFYLLKRSGTALQGKCKPCVAIDQKRRRDSNPHQYLATKRRYRLATHGINKDIFDSMMEEQGGRCAICGSEGTNDSRASYALHIDHDHKCCPSKTSCGKCIRALLCATCNRGLGQFNDDIDLMLKAVAYLQKFQPESGMMA